MLLYWLNLQSVEVILLGILSFKMLQSLTLKTDVKVDFEKVTSSSNESYFPEILFYKSKNWVKIIVDLELDLIPFTT